MDFTYKGSDELARVAAKISSARRCPLALSAYVAMSDPKRIADLTHQVSHLPQDAAVIYRHFGARNKSKTARTLREICTNKGLQLLIGSDVVLAQDIGADGVHFPEKDMCNVQAARDKFPDWILSAAVHSQEGIVKANTCPLDAVILSPVFASKSASAGTPLGIDGFERLSKHSVHPVFALGGIGPSTARQVLSTRAAGLAGVSAFFPNGVKPESVSDTDLAGVLARLHGANFDYGWDESTFKCHLLRPCDQVFVLKRDGEVFGFILTRNIDEDMEILTIVVAKTHRASGYGLVLLAYAENAARANGAKRAFLDVAIDNTAALSLYRRAGYRDLMIRKAYYRRVCGRVDGLVMEKKL